MSGVTSSMDAMTLRSWALGACLVLTLGACGEATSPASGDSASDTETSPSSPSGLPSCDEIWVDGQEFPESYDGCFDGTADVAAEKRTCSMGTPLVTYDGRFYATLGGKANEVSGSLDGDTAYQSALAACTG